MRTTIPGVERKDILFVSVKVAGLVVKQFPEGTRKIIYI